jgi:cell division protease FtsH
MNSRTKTWLIIGAVIISTYFLYAFLLSKPNVSSQQVDISQIVKKIESNEIEKINVDQNKVTAKIKGDGEVYAYKEAGVGLKDYGIDSQKVNIEIKNPDKSQIWPTLLSVVLPFLLIAGIFWLMLRSAQGANVRALSFGKSSPRMFGVGPDKITFKDVAGLEESKQELQEVVEFLRHAERFRKLGAELPKGVLLVGPPGCGKTLLAKAVAGEAGVPFFSISASEFVEMFVGVGAARVRDLFARAKRNTPCVIFVDELDAVGRQRGTGLGGSHDEREQTLNQILVEMDGFDTDTRVIVLAATNRPDVLDPALLRPGRFDRRVVLDLPDMKEREAILKIHTRNKPMAADADLGQIASCTAGFSGADLRNLANEAAILAAREGKKAVETADLQEAIEKVMLGPERKSRVLSEDEKKIAAYHEAGHTIVGTYLPLCDPVHKISIISRGMALGYTFSRPEIDRRLYSKGKFEADLAQLLGGRASEDLFLKEATTGAQNDLQKATKIARDMVTVYGMSAKLGPVALREREEFVFLGRELGEHKNYSERVASLIDEEISRIIIQAEQTAQKILTTKRKIMEKLVSKLLKEETIEGKQLAMVLKG